MPSRRPVMRDVRPVACASFTESSVWTAPASTGVQSAWSNTSCLEDETFRLDFVGLSTSSLPVFDLSDRVTRALEAHRPTGRRCCLTFFLRNARGQGGTLLGLLEAMGLRADADGAAGHFYARMPSERRVVDICRAIARVEVVCADVGGEVIAVDLDETEADRPTSIVNLYCKP